MNTARTNTARFRQHSRLRQWFGRRLSTLGLVLLLALGVAQEEPILYDGSLVYYNVGDRAYIRDTLYGPVKQVILNYGASLYYDQDGKLLVEAGFGEEGYTFAQRYRYNGAGRVTERLEHSADPGYDTYGDPAFQRTLTVQDPRLNGDDVTNLQRRLNDLGYDPGPIDGYYGPLSAEAVSAFQQDYDLEVDGVVGPIAWYVLMLPLETRTEYRYDAQNRRSEVLFYDIAADSGGGEQLFSRERLFYDDEGRVTRRENSFSDNATYTEYRYDTGRSADFPDLVIQTAETFGEDDELLSRVITHYVPGTEPTVDDTYFGGTYVNGRVVLRDRPAYDPENFGAPSDNRRISRYNALGQITSDRFDYADDTNVEDVVHIFVYDDRGEWLEHHTGPPTLLNAPLLSNDTLVERFEYLYDDVGNWIERRRIRPQSGRDPTVSQERRGLRYYGD
ncbi:MAG: peptidoglycan-binding domain-containing protein [Trueperaceae bacterium]|nr:peptidoglycan-binding domain-containing protein [Trueperaceae bacterium]